MTKKTIFITLACLLPLVPVVPNFFDPPLKPEVQKILDAPMPEASEAARHAYEFMLGVMSGETENPERRGAELLPHIYEPNQSKYQRWGQVDFGGCNHGACGVADLTPETEALLKENQAKLDLYAKFLAYGDFAALGRPKAGALTFDPVITPDPSLHRLFTLQLASWLKSGGDARVWDLLESSNRLYAAALRRGDSLLDRMIALVKLSYDARFIKAEMARRPKWRPSPALIDSFDIPDANEILGGALEGELRTVNAMVADQAAGWRRLFLRPHETLNVHHGILQQIFFTDCPKPTRECVPALAYLDPGLSRYLSNQVGRSVLDWVTQVDSTRTKLFERVKELMELKASFRAAK